MARRASLDFDTFLAEVRREPGYRDQIVHRRAVPARAARYAPLAPPCRRSCGGA